jgi:cellulose biosynthesis protein BcsQ
MAKKNILIADADSNYMNNFERFLRINHSDKFFINVKNSTEGIITFVENSDRKIDILLVAPDLFTDRLKKSASVIMILSGGIIPINLEGYAIVKKYQSGDAIVQSIIKKYIEAMPGEFDINELAGECEIVGVFSPIGGSGKTTIAMLLSRIIAAKKKVLYFSLEQMQFTEQVFSGSSKYNMSDFLYYIHKKDKEIIFNLNRMLIQDSNTDVHFLNSPLCFLDLNKIESDKWDVFFKSIVSYGLFNAMIVDIGSHLDEQSLEILSVCQKVIVPVLDDQMSLMKINRLIHDLTQIENEILLKKFIYVLNKYNNYQPHKDISILKTLAFDESNDIMDITGNAILQRPFWKDMKELSVLLDRL